MITPLFNGDKGTVKRFKTLDYEGTQAKTIVELNNNYTLENINVGQIYYDNYPKLGWYVENMYTDMQDGRVPEFIDKENKWFNNIIGLEKEGVEDSLNTAEFSLQGLGSGIDSAPDPGVVGCMDPSALGGPMNSSNSPCTAW